MAPLLLCLLLALSEAAAEPVVIVVRVEPGQNAGLPCNTSDTSIRAAEWIKADLKSPKEILFWRDGKTYSPIKGRVQLVDGELKNGDVSLTLKEVKREDVGTYECRVKTAGSGRKKRAIIDTEPISIVRLLVTDPEDQKGDNKDGHIKDRDTNNRTFTHQHVGLGAAAGVGFVLVCLVSAFVGLSLVRKPKIQRYKKPEPSAVEETGLNLT